MKSAKHFILLKEKALLAVVASLVISVMMACGSQTVPLIAKAGTTFSIAIDEDHRSEHGVGFASLIWTEGDQRGNLIAKLHGGPGPDTDLVTRYITRAAPDLSSSRLVLDKNESSGALGLSLPQQAIGLFDIPCTVVAGQYSIEFRVERPGEAPDLLAEANTVLSQITIENDGQCENRPTQFLGSRLGFVGVPTEAGLAELVPMPTVIFKLPHAANPDGSLIRPTFRPSSAEVVVSYPAEKMQVKGVIAKSHWDADAMVFHQLESPNRVRIQYMGLDGGEVSHRNCL